MVASGNNRLSDEAIRRRFDCWLDKPMSSREWTVVVLQGHMGDFRDVLAADEGEDALEAVEKRAAESVRLMRWSQEKEPQRGQPMLPAPERCAAVEPDSTPREILISFAVAALAAQDADVQTFRREVLDGHLVIDTDRPGGWEDPAAWIERCWRAERLQANTRDGDELPLLQYSPFPGALASDAIEAPPVRALRVVPSGMLDRLRLLAKRLAYDFRWEEAAAVTFILTNSAPIIPPITVEVDWCDRIPTLTRLVLSVDVATTPKQLAAAYRTARAQVAEIFPRQMEGKSMWLVALTAGRVASVSLADLMAEWNRVFPAWAYDDVNTFGGDRRDAERRLLRPEYRRPAERKGTTDDQHNSTKKRATRQPRG